MLIVLLFFPLFFLGCKGTPKSGFKTTGRGPEGKSVSLVTFQGKAQNLWITDVSSKVYSNSRTLSFTGKCSGVGRIQVFTQDQALGAPVECNSKGEFTWTSTVSQDGTFDLQFKSSDGTLVSSKTVEVDTVPPASPVVTSNGGADWTLNTDTFVLDGTTSSETVGMEVNSSSGTLTFDASHSSFTYSNTLSWGISRVLRFVALDFAGNRSDPTQIIVRYFATVGLLLMQESSASVSDQPGANGVAILDKVNLDVFGSSPTPVGSQEGEMKLYLGATAIQSNL